MLLLAPSSFSGATYVAVFGLGPPRLWGCLLLGAGLAPLRRRPWTVGVVVGVAMLWGGLILQAVLRQTAGSYIGWTWPVNFALATYFGTAHKGARGDA